MSEGEGEQMSGHVQRLSALLGQEVETVTAISGGDICDAWRVRLGDGRTVFVKTKDDAPAGFFTTEARGLDLLRRAGGAPIPEVVAAADDCLVLEWVESGAPSKAAAEQLGRGLAHTHRTGFGFFGRDDDGWIGSLSLPNRQWTSWTDMWAEGRLEPCLRQARQQRAVSEQDARDVERVIAQLADLAGPAEPPALIHGDLWSGNVLWGADDVAWLIDPSVHGGHRETDLAMLALFGAPHLGRIIAAYDDEWPLADGWRERVPLHQLHPVLVHAVLFGGSYGAQAGRLARQVIGGR